jgi:hypothetical protein
MTRVHHRPAKIHPPARTRSASAARTLRALVVVGPLAVAAGCASMAPGAGGGGGDDIAPDGGMSGSGEGSGDWGGNCPAIADPFAPSVLQDGIGYLASDQLGGRAPNTPGDVATRAYIEQAFRCAGLMPAGADGGFQQPFTAPDGTMTANVVGYLPGSDPALRSEIIIIGAHHDHLGTVGGQIYNGANDNASGAITVIALARALAAQHPKRTIGFVTFGYEEHVGNCEGSEYFAAHTPAALPIGSVKYMVNADMVGTYMQAGEVTVYGANAGTRGRTILDGLASSYSMLTLTHSGNADTDDSDFQAFADRSIPYVYFETWDEQCYHKPCDDTARIDFASMSKIAQLLRDLVVALAS